MTKQAWRNLKMGDVIKNARSGGMYVVAGVDPKRRPPQVTLMRVIKATDPSQWSRVPKNRLKMYAELFS